jgi:hypothetical protein
LAARTAAFTRATDLACFAVLRIDFFLPAGVFGFADGARFAARAVVFFAALRFAAVLPVAVFRRRDGADFFR